MEVIKINKNIVDDDNKIKLNVAAYARVSTKSNEQQTSFESQKRYYENKIKDNKEWNYVGIYADEGISGTSSKRRDEFLKMIKDAISGKIDLILTKSISRFARNTVDTLKFIRFLREKGVSILFEEENINSGAIQGELLITILGSLAQQESENIASHILTGKEMAIKNGTKKDYHFCYGYDYIKEDGSLVINKQSENVKLIFNLYLKYKSRYKVCTELKRLGIKSPRGSDTWTSGSLLKILENEKYIGNCVFGRYYVYDSFNHRTIKNNGEREIYKYIEHHEPIISKEDFYKAQEILKKNEKEYKEIRKEKDKYKILVAWRGICGFCMSPMNKRRNVSGKSNHVYQCGQTFLKLTADKCPNSLTIKRNEIESSFLKAMKKLRNKINLNTFNDEIEEKLHHARTIIMNDNFDKFNYELYDKLINIIIIGGYDSNNNPDPFKIRFILNEDLIFSDIKKNRKNFIDNNDLVLSFENNVNAKYGYYDDNRNFSHMFIEKIHVSVEVQNNEDYLWKQ